MMNPATHRTLLGKCAGRAKAFVPSVLAMSGRSFLGTLTHVKTSEPVAALTFDDGPHPVSTPKVLEVLAHHGASATFFMLGKAAHKYPALVSRVAEAGHTVANHSWDHPSFALIPGEERRRQIADCGGSLAPYGVRLFRPPFGRQSIASRIDAWRLKYAVVTWSVEVGDWWDENSDRMAYALVTQIQPGSIIILHDALERAPLGTFEPELPRKPLADREPMLKALRTCLARLTGRFRFVTLPQLLECGRPAREGWFKP